MAIEPISGKISKPSAYNFVHEAEKTRDKTELKAGDDGAVEIKAFNADRPGINERRTGWLGVKTKLAAFSFFNAVTAGAVGIVGKLCANSSFMGSQKGGRLQEMVKDYGQTYLNATEINPNDSKGVKFLKGAGKFWSNAMPGAWLGQLGVLGQNYSHNKAVNQEFGNAVQREFGANLNFNSIKDFNSQRAHEAKKTVYQHVHAELNNTVESSQGDYKHGLGRLVTSTGSASLKSAFMKHAENKHTEENVHFLQWSGTTLAKIDPNSPDYDSDHKLSKQELLTLKHDFVDKQDNKRAISIDDNTRKQLLENLDQALGDYEERLNAAQQVVKNNPDSTSAKEQLQQIEQEHLTPKDQKLQNLVPQLQAADASVLSLVEKEIAEPFKKEIDATAKKLNLVATVPSNPSAQDLGQLDEWLSQHKNQAIVASKNDTGTWEFSLDTGTNKAARGNVAAALMDIERSVTANILNSRLQYIGDEMKRLDQAVKNPRSLTLSEDIQRLNELRQEKPTIQNYVNALNEGVFSSRIDEAVMDAFGNHVDSNWKPSLDGRIDSDDLRREAAIAGAEIKGLNGGEIKEILITHLKNSPYLKDIPTSDNL